MKTYTIEVDASNFYNSPKTFVKKAKNLSNLRKNLIREFGDGSAATVKIKVFDNKKFYGTLSMVVVSKNFQPVWIPADVRIPAKAISRSTGRRL